MRRVHEKEFVREQAAKQGGGGVGRMHADDWRMVKGEEGLIITCSEVKRKEPSTPHTSMALMNMRVRRKGIFSGNLRYVMCRVGGGR